MGPNQIWISEIMLMQKMVAHDKIDQRYRLGLKMGLSAHCRVLLHKLTSDLDFCN